jgi:hypothetical protein
VIGLQIRSCLVLCLALLLSGGLFAAATWVVVNSQDYEDVIGGAVWAAQTNSSYLFVLTPSHGAYLSRFLSNCTSPILYFESGRPVDPSLSSALPSSSLSVQRSSTLWPYFAAHSPRQTAILLASGHGGEAVSAAPYAAMSGAGLYFSTAAGAPGELERLRAGGRQVIVYGSIASSLPPAQLSGADVIHTPSSYSDNLELLKRWSASRPVSGVLFASGHTFEKSMVLSGLPVALVGRTEVPPALESWLASSGVRNGLAVQGDADIGQAINTLRSDLNLSIFAILGEGYTGDAQMKPAAVMPLPGPAAVPRLDGLSYDADARTFSMRISNLGDAALYTRVVVILPSGLSSSSLQVSIPPASSRPVPVQLDAGSYASSSSIEQVGVQVYSGDSSSASDSMDSLTYRLVPVARSTSWPSSIPRGSSAPAMLVALIALALLISASMLLRAPAPCRPSRRTKR